MPSAHAKLSPSSAERWISCPASVRVIESMDPQPQGTSIFAAEGTAAHTLGELLARAEFHGGAPVSEAEEWREQNQQFDVEEIIKHVKGYVDFLVSRGANEVLLEQRMDTGIANCWGTADAVLVFDDRIEIVDLKYGRGLAVYAEDNPQLALYALGAYRTFGELLGVREVTMTIYQPRLNIISSVTMSVSELTEWAATTQQRAELAMSPEAPFGPSEAACRWCPAAGECVARQRYMTQLDFGHREPDLLTDAELAEAYSRTDEVTSWAAAIKAAALRRVYLEGAKLPGYKVVLSGQRRVIKNPPAVVEVLLAEDWEMGQITTAKLKGFGELEKLVGGRKAFDALVGVHVTQTEGSPSLVPESDKRQPTTSAREDFSALTGDG